MDSKTSQQYPEPYPPDVGAVHPGYTSQQPVYSSYGAQPPYSAYPPIQSHAPPAYPGNLGALVNSPDGKSSAGLWYLGAQIPDPNLPKAGLGAQKVPGYNPADDWEKLENMVQKFERNDVTCEAADPLRVCRLLLTRTIFQRDALNDYVRAIASRSLYQWIQVYAVGWGSSCGKAVDAMRGLAEGPLGYDLALLEDMLKEFLTGCDEMTMVELICDRRQEDLQLLMSQYKKECGEEMADAIKKQYAGRKLERLLLSALSLERPPDNLPVDQSQVQKDVSALQAAAKSKDDKVFSDVLTKRSRPHIAAIVTEYASKHGSLRKEIKKKLKGNFGNGILYIVDGAKSKRDGQGIWRDAKLLEETMKGLGTKNTKLHYRVVRASWTPQRFTAVKEAYKQRYGKTLEDRIASDTSAYHRETLHTICQIAASGQ